jgi:hypothetical protein
MLIVSECVPAHAQSTAPTIPVPETIRAEGVPPIPASVHQALNRYQNIRSASFQDWASDGSGMYIITRFADVPQVHFVAADATDLPRRAGAGRLGPAQARPVPLRGR